MYDFALVGCKPETIPCRPFLYGIYEWLGCIGTKQLGTIVIIPSSISFAVFAPAHDLND